MEHGDTSRNGYLLTWNPRAWHWDDLEDNVSETAQGRPVIHCWSTGGAKRIEPGDRLFLLRQGSEPRGVMGAGWAISEPYEGGHWDEDRWERGDTMLGVDVRFDRIFNPEVDEILTLDRLRTGSLAAVHWTTQRSGIRIKQGLEELERLWAELVGFYDVTQSDAGVPGAVEGDLRVALSRHRAREGWLRDEKIAQAKATSNGRLPCKVCGFDFLQSYGELGRDYAQVHHLKPLGDRTKPSRTLLTDLAVLCANCHVMVHRHGGALPLNSLLVPVIAKAAELV